MNLEQTKEIILKWLKSCETAEQLDFIIPVMDKFLFQKYAGLLTVFEYDQMKKEMQDAWTDQKMSILLNWKEESEIPTLFLHDSK